MNAPTPYEQLMAARLDQVPVPDMADAIWAGIEAQLGAGGAPGSGGDGPDAGGDGLGGDAPEPGGDGPGPGGDAPRGDGSEDGSGEESQTGQGKQFRTWKGWGWYGLLGVTVVVALLWWYYGHRNLAPERTALPAMKDAPATEDTSAGRDVPVVKDAPVGRDEPAMKDVPAVKETLPARDGGAIIHVPAKKNILMAPVKKDTLLNDHGRLDTPFRQVPAPAVIDTSSRQHNVIPPPSLPQVVPATRPPGGKKHRGVKGITEDDYRISTKKDSTGRKN